MKAAEGLDGGGAGALHEMEGVHDEGLDAGLGGVAGV